MFSKTEKQRKPKETKKGEGVDNIPLKILLEKRPDSKNRWELIDKLIK